MAPCFDWNQPLMSLLCFNGDGRMLRSPFWRPFAFALFSRCFDFLLDSGPVLCCLIKAESLWGQGPQRTWAAPSSARHIITSFRNEGSDKDHHLRITGPDGTCWYQLWQFTQTETLQTLCTHIQTVYTVSLQPLKHDKSVEKHITHTHLQMYIWL